MILTQREIAYLSPSFTERTQLSPFSKIGLTQDGTENKSLTEKGIIVGNGYSPEALDLLVQLANPTKSIRISIQNDLFLKEIFVYRNNDKIILAEKSKGDFNFSKLKSTNDMINSFSNIFGISKIKAADVTFSLDTNEMMVFLAVIDIYRKNALLDYTGKESQTKPVSMQDISNELASGFVNGLVSILTKKHNCKIPLSNDVFYLLATLVEKKYLILEKGYKLTENCALFAKNFLIADSTIIFEYLEIMANGSLSKDDSLCINAGLNNITTFSFKDDKIEFKSISAFQLKTKIESILSNITVMKETIPTAPKIPTSLTTPPTPIAAASTMDDVWICSCGTKNTRNFCSICGNKKPNL